MDKHLLLFVIKGGFGMMKGGVLTLLMLDSANPSDPLDQWPIQLLAFFSVTKIVTPIYH